LEIYEYIVDHTVNSRHIIVLTIKVIIIYSGIAGMQLRTGAPESRTWRGLGGALTLIVMK